MELDSDMDEVWELAEILVDYSVVSKSGDVVMISADLDGSQLMEVVTEESSERGRSSTVQSLHARGDAGFLCGSITRAVGHFAPDRPHGI